MPLGTTPDIVIPPPQPPQADVANYRDIFEELLVTLDGVLVSSIVGFRLLPWAGEGPQPVGNYGCVFLVVENPPGTLVDGEPSAYHIEERKGIIRVYHTGVKQ